MVYVILSLAVISSAVAFYKVKQLTTKLNDFKVKHDSVMKYVQTLEEKTNNVSKKATKSTTPTAVPTKRGRKPNNKLTTA